MRNSKIHNKIWTERKWLDTWSVNHFLFGMISCYCLGLYLDALTAFWVAFLAYFLWEVFEFFMKLEIITNQFMDIVVSIFGFLLVALILPSNIGITIIIFIFVLMELYGYATKFGFIGTKEKVTEQG